MKIRIKAILSRLVLTDYLIFGGGLVVVLAIALGAWLMPKPDIALSGQFSAIRDRGALRVGIHSGIPGLAYTGDTIETVFGLEPDIGRAVAMRLFGEEKIEFVEVNQNSKGPKLNMDEMDICVAQYVSDSESRFAFSKPYFTDQAKLIVRRETFVAPQSLAGQTIGILKRAGAGTAISAWFDRNRVEVQFATFQGIPDMIDALRDGRIAAFGLENSLLINYVGEGMIALPDSLGDIHYAIAVRKEDSDLLALCDDTMEKLISSGVLDQLKAAWNLAGQE